MLKLPVCLFLSGFLTPVAQVHIEADEIKTAKSDQTVDDSGKPGHISKDEGYQVKAEDTDQQPVECTNDDKGKRSAVQVFISHSYLTFCTVSGTGCISFCNLPLFIHNFALTTWFPYFGLKMTCFLQKSCVYRTTQDFFDKK